MNVPFVKELFHGYIFKMQVMPLFPGVEPTGNCAQQNLGQLRIVHGNPRLVDFPFTASDAAVLALDLPGFDWKGTARLTRAGQLERRTPPPMRGSPRPPAAPKS